MRSLKDVYLHLKMLLISMRLKRLVKKLLIFLYARISPLKIKKLAIFVKTFLEDNLICQNIVQIGIKLARSMKKFLMKSLTH